MFTRFQISYWSLKVLKLIFCDALYDGRFHPYEITLNIDPGSFEEHIGQDNDPERLEVAHSKGL